LRNSNSSSSDDDDDDGDDGDNDMVGFGFAQGKTARCSSFHQKLMKRRAETEETVLIPMFEPSHDDAISALLKILHDKTKFLGQTNQDRKHPVERPARCLRSDRGIQGPFCKVYKQTAFAAVEDD